MANDMVNIVKIEILVVTIDQDNSFATVNTWIKISNMFASVC
jgi:hypothetical protein